MMLQLQQQREPATSFNQLFANGRGTGGRVHGICSSSVSVACCK